MKKKDKKTKRQKDKKTKRQKDKRQKDKRQIRKREFDIVMSGQFRTLAMFQREDSEFMQQGCDNICIKTSKSLTQAKTK